MTQQSTNTHLVNRLLAFGFISTIFLFLSAPATAGVLFFDDFLGDAEDVDRTTWTSPVGGPATFGRTTIRNPADDPIEGLPTKVKVVDGIAQLRLDTYNPTAIPTNRNFWGSEIDTIQEWKPSAGEGISFEARVRNAPNLPGGIITSMFAFGLTGNGFNNKDEIDFEILTNSPNQIFTNRFQDEPATSSGDGSLVVLPAGTNVEEFNTYRIDWFEDEINWYVNDLLVNSANTDIPTEAMGLRLNIWVPNLFFSQAFNNNLQPDTTLASNRTYLYEVDWAKVSTTGVVPEPATMVLFGMGLVGLRFKKQR